MQKPKGCIEWIRLERGLTLSEGTLTVSLMIQAQVTKGLGRIYCYTPVIRILQIFL